ncbi:MAG TPA: glycosyltransferase family A protein [Bryobacteraceae bacterium]|jgi:glycosyltransferase involved in cell wall biosynthesis|nr:glycosyltransferase family A protein [Bryobacteraceae bacterium]
MQPNELDIPKVSVVVCTYNRAAMLRRALQSLTVLTTGSTFTYEIVVVDDGSTDDTAAVVQALPANSAATIRYLRQANAGVASARNTGVRSARGEWIAFFDDDQLAEPNWLRELFAAVCAEDADFAGGPCRPLLPAGVDAATLSQTIRRLLGENPLMMASAPRATWDPRSRLNALPGTGNVLIRRKLFDTVGFFTETRHYGEDLEFFRRAVRHGARLAIAPQAIVWHVIPPNRLSPEYLFRLARLGGESQAEIDRNVRGVLAAHWMVVLRTAHVMLSVLPGLVRARITGDGPLALSKRCSLHFARAYVSSALHPRRNEMPRPLSPAPATPQPE